MTSPFARPGNASGGDKFEAKDWFDPNTGQGALLIVFPKFYDPNMQTKHSKPDKPTPGADCDIVIVDRIDPATGTSVFLKDARIFGNLANSVRDNVGKEPVLGRLGQVPTNQGNPAWVLIDVLDNPAEIALASPALVAYQQGQFKPATPPPSMNAQASAAQDPWAGVNAAPAPQQQYAAPPQQYAQPTGPPGQQYIPPQQQYTPAPAPAAPPQQYAPPQTPAADPVSAFLASRNMDPNAIAGMDPATREGVARQLGYQG